jgi:hypothetical protein
MNSEQLTLLQTRKPNASTVAGCFHRIGRGNSRSSACHVICGLVQSMLDTMEEAESAIFVNKFNTWETWGILSY